MYYVIVLLYCMCIHNYKCVMYVSIICVYVCMLVCVVCIYYSGGLRRANFKVKLCQTHFEGHTCVTILFSSCCRFSSKLWCPSFGLWYSF